MRGQFHAGRLSRRSGASGACSRASIAIPSSVCAPRSSRWRPRDFLRFLFEWQRVLPEARMQGSDAVAAVLAQLEGYEAPAGAWETEILPARITEYEPEWLDEHCRAGRFVWTRLEPRAYRTAIERGARRCARRPSPAREAQRQSLVGIRRRARSGAPDLACPRRAGLHRDLTAPRSSMRSPSMSACCRSKPRRRSRSWSRSAW